MTRPCPCGSLLSYEECCGKYHLGAIPESALKLMKARYSAYAVGNLNFILSTTHPKHVDTKKELALRRKEIEHFSRTTVFKRLEIVNEEPGELVSYVTFSVFLEQEGKPLSFTEKSTFEKVEGKWLYLIGKMISL